MSGESNQKSFWTSIPGVLTGLAGLITAVGTLLVALNGVGIFKFPAPTPTPTPSASAESKPLHGKESKNGVASPPELRKTSFAFPGGGEKNNNQAIGPFCCTGETATVASADGQPLGYIYFFGWQGQAYNQGNTSVAPSVEILVSGLADLSNPRSPMEKASVLFLASDGGTRKTVRAGGLSFEVSLEAQSLPFNNQRYFDMSSIKATVDVSR